MNVKTTLGASWIVSYSEETPWRLIQILIPLTIPIFNYFDRDHTLSHHHRKCIPIKFTSRWLSYPTKSKVTEKSVMNECNECKKVWTLKFYILRESSVNVRKFHLLNFRLLSKKFDGKSESLTGPRFKTILGKLYSRIFFLKFQSLFILPTGTQIRMSTPVER